MHSWQHVVGFLKTVADRKYAQLCQLAQLCICFTSHTLEKYHNKLPEFSWALVPTETRYCAELSNTAAVVILLPGSHVGE